jgi:hypothetical protein
MASKKLTNDITVYGTTTEIDNLAPALATLSLTGSEGRDRLLIAKLIEEFQFNAEILYKGNTVWNEKKLLRNLSNMVRSNNMNLMTDYLYKFFSLSCGSSAHSNRYGWINEYPTIASLRQFFHRNEFGQSVLAHQPMWKTDAIQIVTEMNKILKGK